MTPSTTPLAASEGPRRRHGPAFGRTVGVGLVLLATACTAQAQQGRTVTVFAAASLRSAFTAEAAAFERSHPGTQVVLSFAGSQSLVAQVQQGAPADVLATADQTTLRLVASDLSSGPRVLAHNQLAIVTAPGNPLRLHSLADLARTGLKVVLAGPSVPAGRASAAALAAAGVTLHPVSLEDAVTGVVGKIRLGEADAGLAYVTDLGHDVDGTPLPGTTTTLALGTLTDTGLPFADFLLGAEGQAILRAHGFR